MVSESLSGNIETVDLINEYLTSPHKAVRCTVKLQKSVKWIQQLEEPKKLPGVSGGKALDKDKEDRRNWELEQDMRYLKDGVDDENKHFEECFRDDADFGESRQKESGGNRAQQNHQRVHGHPKYKRGW